MGRVAYSPHTHNAWEALAGSREGKVSTERPSVDATEGEGGKERGRPEGRPLSLGCKSRLAGMAPSSLRLPSTMVATSPSEGFTYRTNDTTCSNSHDRLAVSVSQVFWYSRSWQVKVMVATAARDAQRDLSLKSSVHLPVSGTR
jgi:hypothetical protein